MFQFPVLAIITFLPVITFSVAAIASAWIQSHFAKV